MAGESRKPKWEEIDEDIAIDADFLKGLYRR